MVRAVVLMIVAACLAACVSILPEKKAPEALYRFGPMESMHALDASIVIREPEASRLVGGRAIAAEDSDGALRLVKDVEWTDSVTRMMQVALLDTLGGSDGGIPLRLTRARRPTTNWPGASPTSRCRARRPVAASRRRFWKVAAGRSWPRRMCRRRPLRLIQGMPHVQRP